ncbi:hypothetical protein IF188_10280 [Microbacterium sp. NEAU-LLC]|uniref:Heparinase II/III-like protein n=1 Tax=Microbacterium helvum TaxID=2773713 RepID=A0ABR8NNS8_9MICO|nr:hypothetical protein [Microbacterium helvum]MBD3942083.1 hypothetical protein [Microbacterium helvum]
MDTVTDAAEPAVDELTAAMIAGALEAGDAAFDPEWDLPLVPAPYNPIHTRIVSGEAHFVRDGMTYALALFEAGRRERGERVLRAVLGLQDRDPSSATYGVWPYWAEEPLSEMSPPDWNWADFIGELIALVLYRHDAGLSPELAADARDGLRHAAQSIIRRNVDIDYTNIVAKGSFVLLAAGEFTGDPVIAVAAADRIRRLRDRLLEQRTFAEYNSPTYWVVVLQALTEIRQYVSDPTARTFAEELERLAWEHFLRRWHPQTGRLSGPMARCYDTDLRRDKGELRPQGVRLILQRVDPEHWTITGAAGIRPAIGLAHSAVVDYRLPDDLRPLLSDLGEGSRTVVETFSQVHHLDEEYAGVSAADVRGRDAVVLPAVGTTWLSAAATLGSIAHSDTWAQRRVLLGFWAEPGDDIHNLTSPMRSVSATVVRDGHDFAAGSFSSAQHDGTVLWAFGLACPGGDEHIHLDGIVPGEARPTTGLSVRFTLTGIEAAATVDVDGTSLAVGDRTHGTTLRVTTDAVRIDWALAAAACGDDDDRTALVERGADGTVTIEIAWVAASTPQDLVLSDLGTAFAAGSLRIAERDAATAVHPVSVRLDHDVAHLALPVDGDGLRLSARTTVGTRRDHALAYRQGARA